MTIQELYDWAKENNALDGDLIIRDCYGSETHWIEPVVIHYDTYYEVEL